MIKIGEPKLKTNHHMFNVRAVYSNGTFFKNSYTHPVFMLFAGLICVARYFILTTLIPGPLRFIMPAVVPQLVSLLLIALYCFCPEKFREFLFGANITNVSRSEVNELDLISKQSEVERMNEIADDISNGLYSIDVQQPMQAEQLPMQV